MMSNFYRLQIHLSLRGRGIAIVVTSLANMILENEEIMSSMPLFIFSCLFPGMWVVVNKFSHGKCREGGYRRLHIH